jgi:hypothetical protein
LATALPLFAADQVSCRDFAAPVFFAMRPIACVTNASCEKRLVPSLCSAQTQAQCASGQRWQTLHEAFNLPSEATISKRERLASDKDSGVSSHCVYYKLK